MSKITKWYILFVGLLMAAQLVLLREYLLPLPKDSAVVKNISSTTPADAVIVKGEEYLRRITPENIKGPGLFYDEIIIAKDSNPAAKEILSKLLFDYVVITGSVVGKSEAEQGFPSIPIVRIESARLIKEVLYPTNLWSLVGMEAGFWAVVGVCIELLGRWIKRRREKGKTPLKDCNHSV